MTTVSRASILLNANKTAVVGGDWQDKNVNTVATSPSMIGRKPDLDALRDEFEVSLTGRPRAVVVGGEAGIGKTRLIDEFTAGVSAEALVLVGKCVDLGADGAPYAPFTAVLRALSNALGVGDEGRDRLLHAAGPGRSVLPVLLPELSGLESMPERTGAERLYELVAVLFETVSREHPIVIVIEDIHWADTATLEMVRFLVRMLAESRILLLMTYRSDEVPRGHPLRSQLPELERTRRLARLDLKRLTRAEVRAQLAGIRGSAPSADAVDAVFRRSEGVPFFVEELACVDNDGVDVLPETLRELLLVRYERLSDSAQSVLRLLSAGGDSVDHSLISNVFDGDADALDAAVREAIGANLLTANDTEYTFRHALVREAIHADLLPGERTRFHSRFAAALESDPQTRVSDAAAISYHWHMAHDLTKAFSATVEAMVNARDSYAYTAAAHMGERALELWDQVPDAAELAQRGHVELLQETAIMLRDAGEAERALALINLALDECSTAQTELYATLLREKATFLATLSRPGSSALLEQALAMIPNGSESRVRSLLLSDLGARLMLEARFDEAIDIATRAIEESTRTNARARMSVAHTIRGVSHSARGDFDAGLRDLDAARELAETSESAMLRYRVNASDVMTLLGRYDDAVCIGEAGSRRARELGVERTSGAILFSNIVEALLALGDWPRAEELLGPALALDAPPGFRVHLQRMRLWLSVWKGDVASAVELVRGWRGGMLVQSEIEMQSRLGFARVDAEIALAQGDLDAAWRAASIVLSPQHRTMSGYDLPLLTVAARVIARLRIVGQVSEPDPDVAEIALRAVLEQSEAWPTASVWIPLFNAELSGPRKQGTSVSGWQRAVAAVSQPTAPAHLKPYALFRLAQAHLEAGDRVDAEAAACAARRRAREIGAGLVVGWVDDLSTRAGFDLGSSAARGAATLLVTATSASIRLTERERQVLELIGHGMSNRQIGEQLFISTKTASVHVSAILRKLGASSRTEAVYLAQQAGVPVTVPASD
jgi:DNA-binding CsgD family transcriptional regulator/tetratricopeptide (TPR) repeat protein